MNELANVKKKGSVDKRGKSGGRGSMWKADIFGKTSSHRNKGRKNGRRGAEIM